MNDLSKLADNFSFFQAFDDVPATQLQSGEDIQCEFCEKVKLPEGSPL